jgi:hypothetical protein
LTFSSANSEEDVESSEDGEDTPSRQSTQVTGEKMDYEYVEDDRIGDHICYISDLTKMKNDFPGWGISKSIQDIFEEIAGVIR